MDTDGRGDTMDEDTLICSDGNASDENGCFPQMLYTNIIQQKIEKTLYNQNSCLQTLRKFSRIMSSPSTAPFRITAWPLQNTSVIQVVSAE